MTPDLFMELLYDFAMGVVPTDGSTSVSVQRDRPWPGLGNGQFAVHLTSDESVLFVVLRSDPVEVVHCVHMRTLARRHLAAV